MKQKHLADTEAVSLKFNKNDSLKSTILSALTLKNMPIMAALLALVFALYGVVFWLPSSVEKPETITDVKVIMAAQSREVIDESPWRESQLAKHRQTAQQILSQVLEKQDTLENKKVLLWAKELFEKALNTAQAGDLFYRNQEFSQAMAKYSDALLELTELEQSIAQRFKLNLAKGQTALSASNALLAIESLTLAMYMQPENSQASQAFDRAIVLEQVIALVKASVVEVDEQNYQAAKNTLNEALELDNKSEIALEQLSQVNHLITENSFSKAMSTGYRALKKQPIPASY
jgi:tetratricopeptide (TPR) repeat protein